VTVVDGWLFIRYLHLLAVAFFVGGQLMLAAVVVPVERRARDRERIGAIAKRFGWGTLVALAVLLSTGIPLATHLHLWDDGTLQLKLALVALAGILIGWHVRRPERRELDAAIFLVSLAIVWLGLVLAH
jgi:uncharacterized membrane protein